MKLVVLIALLVLRLTIGTVAAGSARAIRVSVLGDSLALGIGASDSSSGFAFDLFRRIVAERPGSEITNLAIGGTTATDVGRLEVPRLAATRPDVVFLEVGANDAVRRRSSGAFASDFAALVRSVRAAVPHARVVIFNVPDLAVSPIFEESAKPTLRRLVVRYNASVAADARALHARVVDLYQISERARHDTDRFFSSDLFHPSDAGHAAIATAAWPIVRGSLEGRLR